MPKRLIPLAARLRDHEPFYIEMLSGLTALVWGLYSAISWARLEDNPIYRPLTHLLPGACIEALSVVLGVVQLVVLAEDRPARRAAVASVMSMWWALPARLILDSETGAPAVTAYGIWGVLGNCIVIWCYGPELMAAARRSGSAFTSYTQASWRRLRGER